MLCRGRVAGRVVHAVFGDDWVCEGGGASMEEGKGGYPGCGFKGSK